MKIKVINNSGYPLPKFETPGSAGMDLHAAISEDVNLWPGEWKLIPTGIHMQLPDGYEAQIRSRSGLALKKGIFVLNAPGTIDTDYTGDVGVILANLSKGQFIVHPGDRIAQMVIAKYEQPLLVEVTELDETERGDGGFGHTNI